MKNSETEITSRVNKGIRLGLAAYFAATMIVAALLAYFAVMLVSTQEVEIGPVIVEFHTRPSWRGLSIVELPPAGSLRADTHRTPVELVYTLKEISVDRVEELTREDSASREALRNWHEPVESHTRAFLLKITVVAALTAGSIVWLIKRRWRWALAGTAVGAIIALTLFWLTWSTYDFKAFAEPSYTGSLARAPEVVGFSQEFLANLDTYSDQVPRIADNLYRTVNELQHLPDSLPLEDSIRVLHVSDLHNSGAGAQLLTRVVNLYAIDLVIDTGDISELGLPFELDYPRSFLPLNVPYIWISGNHDSRLVSETMRQINGVTVLDNTFTTAAGMTIGGFPDPSTVSLLPRVATGSELAENSIVILDLVRSNTNAPEIVAVHDPGQAEQLPGTVPVVLSGHTHMSSIEVTDSTVIINAGSTGGGGLRGFESGRESPISLQVLYFNDVSRHLMAVDTIAIYGISQEFQVTRRIFGE